MKISTSYNQGDRVTVLVVTLFALIFFFRLHIFITIIPFECWDLHEIWEHEPYYFSPFSLYVTCLCLFLVWSLVELWIGVCLKTGVYVKVVSALSAGTVLFLMFGFFHFWQFLQIEKGALPKEAYFWQISKNMTTPKPVQRYSDFPTWHEYVVEQRCDRGLAISNMSDEEKKALRDNYWGLRQSVEE
ncbi:hypothetical protein [Teredinibacter purpureus]|uniref:hypothetical protein n=1 Tax=Teredinibacter purpureus TaxID=2731756 RepID=UPI0005F76970|nr:hypothetical protein [Teredinibacter purpureus]